MSSLGNDWIECPNCFNGQKVPVWRTVNVSVDAEYKAKVLDLEVYRHRCLQCQTVFFLNHSLLYHDPSKQLMISCAAESQRHLVVPDRLPVLKGYQTRSVSIPEALAETIVIFDSELDDRAIALLKYVMLRNLLIAHASTLKKMEVLPLDPQRLLFVGGSSSLCFLLLTSAPVPITMLISVDEYSKMLTTLKSFSSESVGEEWASYDYAWADRLLSEKRQLLNFDLLFSPDLLKSRPAAMPLWHAHCDRMALLQQTQRSKRTGSLWASFKRWITEN